MRLVCLGVALFGLGLGILLGLGQLKGYLTKPQALLVLGGDPAREVFAAQFARTHPDLPIWISSGANPEYTEWVFEWAGLDTDRLHLDYQAADTVTNFTTMISQFKREGITSIYLMTSDYHMPRARIIGTIVFGSHGIYFRPVIVPSDRATEPVEKSIRDGIRSIVWLITGRTVISLPQPITSQP